MRWITKFCTAMLFALVAPSASGADDSMAECGLEAPCHIANGSYYARPPSGWDRVSPLPAVIYFHGYRQSGRTVLGMKALKRAADENGILLVAPNGAQGRWGVRGAPSEHRDDIAFARDLVRDIAARWPVDPARLWVSGFSLGGSMAWDIACLSGDLFAGFLPVSGAFWRPHPSDCPSGPVTMLHVHGRGDKVVPLEGRTIRERWRQGNVLEGIAFWRAHDKCTPDEIERTGDRGLLCREWRNCSGGKRLALCLYDGGHAAPKDWYSEAFRWLQQTIPPRS